MSKAQTNGSTPPGLFTHFPFPSDFAVSWAGSGPSPADFCLGSEDGRILFTGESFLALCSPGKGSISGEAINGVAFSGEYIAVTTRADFTIGKPQFDRTTNKVVNLPCGAHGVVSTPSGCFALAMGRKGIGLIRADSMPGDAIGILASGKEEVCVHRVIAQRGRNEKDLLVCAAGRGGIGITEVRWGDKTVDMRVAGFKGVDVVDVCAVDSEPQTPAVAAVGRDGTLIVVRDAFHERTAACIKFKATKGTAYRLLSRGEDLFLLTSHALYVVKQLAARLASGPSDETLAADIMTFPLEAVDANIAHDRWLLVLTADEILKGDLDLIEHRTPAGPSSHEVQAPQDLSPVWQSYSLPSGSLPTSLAECGV